MLLTSIAHAAPTFDEVFSDKDKQTHFFIGTLCTVSTFIALTDDRSPTERGTNFLFRYPKLSSAMICMVLNLAKEFADELSQGGSGFDRDDFVAGTMGVMIGLTITRTFSMF